MTARRSPSLLTLNIHSVAIIAPAWRDTIATRLGLLRWQTVYSIIAIIGLVLIVQGYSQASQAPVILYQPPLWLRHIALLLLVFVFPLLLATYLPGRIQMTTKHPMLAATKLWAFAHLLANGALADVVLFAAFLVWAVVDRISMRWRTPLPVTGLAASPFNDALAIILGLGLYVLFIFWLHAWLFGVSPLI